MTPTGRATCEQVRIILIRPGSGNLCVFGNRGAFALPGMYIPAYSRHAEEITAAMLRLHSIETYCLFTLPCGSGPLPAHHYSFSCLANGNCPPSLEFHWADQGSIAREEFQDERDFVAIQTGYELIHRCLRNPEAGYFGRPGWLEEITDWTQKQLARQGRCLAGGCTQLNASATTSLLRFETNSSAVWFKAVGEPNIQEFPITLYLARHFPEFVPLIVAAHEKCRGWLTTEVPGSHLATDSDDATWIATAQALAEFQYKTIGHAPQLRAAGCADLRSDALAGLVAPFLEVMAGLMDEQTKPSPAPLSRSELDSLGNILLDAISTSDGLELPPALVHLDFNLGNVIADADHVIFLDWAAAAVGNPFLPFEYLLEQLRALRPADSALHTAVSNAYAHPWRRVVDEDDLRQALRVAPLLAAFAYATSGGAWRDPTRRPDPSTAGYLRSMTRRLKREAECWTSGSKSGAAIPQPR